MIFRKTDKLERKLFKKGVNKLYKVRITTYWFLFLPVYRKAEIL